MSETLHLKFPLPPQPALTAKRLKVTTVLDPPGLLKVAVPEGKPRVTLRIHLPDREVTAEIAAKSVRKAQAAIRESGADNIASCCKGTSSAAT